MEVESARDNYTPPSPEEIFSLYSDMVYRIAFLRTKSQEDADDILQDVFVRYIRTMPELRSEGHLRAWLIRVTINRSLSLLSSAWRRRRSELPDQLLAEMNENSEVYYAVLELPEKDRIVIHLHYYEGYTFREIAQLTGSTTSAVKSRVFKARSLLRQKLKEEL